MKENINVSDVKQSSIGTTTGEPIGKYKCDRCGKRTDEVKKFEMKLFAGEDDRTGIPFYYSRIFELCLDCAASKNRATFPY